jgi:hypothetical protein
MRTPSRDQTAAVTVSVKPGQAHFAPGWWPVTARNSTASVARRQSDPLPLGEEALFAADVEALAIVVESDRHHSGDAHIPLDGADAHRVRVALDPADPSALLEVAPGDQHPHGGLTSSDNGAGIRRDAEPDQLTQRIGLLLLDGARVVHDALRALLLRLVHESGTATTR